MTCRGGGKPPYHCAICEQPFPSKTALRQHTANHSDISNKKLICATCGWNFDDSHALELHRIQSSHGDPQTAHPNPRNESLKTLTKESEMAITCNRCQKTFTNQKQHNAHRSNVASDCADWRHTAPKHSTTSPEAARGYVDLDRPKHESRIVPSYEDPNATTTIC
jgi:DNA-directed RNA polymerase subunit RPC12/RpoP